jgi:integrase
MTVADLCTHFLAHTKERLEAGAIAGQTYYNYRQNLTHHVIPFLGTMKLCKLKKSVVQSWYYDLHKRVPEGTLPEKAKTVLALAVRYAADDDRGWVSVGDSLVMFRKLDAPKRKPRRTHVKTDDLLHFFTLFKRRFPQYELPFRIVLTTGMRAAEMAGLQWEHCDMVNRCFNVVSQHQRIEGLKATKNKSERLGVEMVESVHDLLFDHHWIEMGRPESGYVFSGCQGGPTIYASMAQAIRALMSELGWFEIINGKRRFRFSMHSLRRYYISHIKEQLSLQVASESVGHASLAQTKDYCRPVLDNPERRKTVEELAALIALPAPDTTERTT